MNNETNGTKKIVKLHAYSYSRNHSRHVGICMNLVAEMVQEMCVACDLSTKCTVQNCLGNVGDI